MQYHAKSDAKVRCPRTQILQLYLQLYHLVVCLVLLWMGDYCSWRVQQAQQNENGCNGNVILWKQDRELNSC